VRQVRGFSTVGRAFAAAAAVASLVGQLFALSHEIAVRHVRCAEHGELTHVAIASGATAIATEAPARNALSAQETAASTVHDHCVTALTLQASVAPPAPRGAVEAKFPPAKHPPPRAPAPLSRSSLLASAPKTSPPSV
jgi:hypothetical protein